MLIVLLILSFSIINVTITLCVTNMSFVFGKNRPIYLLFYNKVFSNHENFTRRN